LAGLPRPGGNIAGFVNAEAAMGGKWLQLLKEIAPGLERVALMFNPNTAPGGGSYFLATFEAAARSSAVEPIIAHVGGDSEIEAAIADLGHQRGGLVITPDSFMAVRNRLLISVVMRNEVPAMFELPLFARQGGLMSYGANLHDLFPRAEMRRSHVRFSRPEASNHTLSLVDFIIIMSGSRFSVYTAFQVISSDS
jgi:putative ABC transport system substrate-binding protein